MYHLAPIILTEYLALLFPTSDKINFDSLKMSRGLMALLGGDRCPCFSLDIRIVQSQLAAFWRDRLYVTIIN